MANCSNCGQQLPENATTCISCGMPIKQAKTKKKGFLKYVTGVIICVCVYTLGNYVVGPLLAGSFQRAGRETSSQQGQEQIAKTKSPEYMNIFESRGIEKEEPPFSSPSVESYAMVMEDSGMISCMDYGCDGDLVTERMETAYYPTDQYTEEEKQTLDTEIRNALPEYRALPFIELSYEQQESYYVFKIYVMGLDNKENIAALVESGIKSSEDTVSMSSTAESLLAEGYIKA